MGDHRARPVTMRRWQRAGRRAALAVAAAAVALVLCPSAVSAQAEPGYLYNLSNFSGTLRYDWVRVVVDQEGEEAYVLYQNLVRVFSPSGMEVFSFGDDLDLGHIVDVAAGDSGEIILLSYKDSQSLVTRCDFRGRPVASIEISGLPAGVGFDANRMVYRNGLFYFASLSASTVIVTDSNGVFKRRVALLPMLDEEERLKSGAESVGFTVDHEGNIYFTVPALFRVFKYAPDGELWSFGKPGSTPGKFGVIAGIVADAQGNLFVADKLNCVVMMFDKSFNFVTQFGYRGVRPENLVVPGEVAIDRRNRLYVSQGKKRGVSVFAVPGS